MAFGMESDIFADIQDCECGGEAPPAFTLPPPPPPPGLHYVQEPREDHLDGSSSWTCPVLINTPQHYEDSMYATVAATCVAALLLFLVIVVTVASRKRSSTTYSGPSSSYRVAASPPTKPSPRTPSHLSYASLEPSFAVEYFSTPIKGATCPSPTYCTPCSPTSTHAFHSTLSPFSPLAISPSPYSPLDSAPCSSRVVPRCVRCHTSSHSCSQSLARPHTSARTQPAHPRRSPLYRPRLAKVVSGQLLVLPGADAIPHLHQKPLVMSPVPPSPRAVDNVYSPLPVSSNETAFVFP